MKEIYRCLSLFQNIVLFSRCYPQSGVCLHSPGYRRLPGVPRLPLPQKKNSPKRHSVSRTELQHGLSGMRTVLIKNSIVSLNTATRPSSLSFPKRKTPLYHLCAYLCATYKLLWLQMCFYTEVPSCWRMWFWVALAFIRRDGHLPIITVNIQWAAVFLRLSTFIATFVYVFCCFM